MAISDIIKYQKLDLTLYNLEREYSQSVEIKRVYHFQKLYKDRLDTLVKLNSELEELYNQLARLETKFDEINLERSAFEVDFQQFQEIKEFEEYEKSLAKYEDSLINLNRDVSRVVKRISEINADNKKINDNMDTLNKDHGVASQVLTAKKQEMQKSAQPILLQLKEMEKNIDKKMLNSYHALRKAKKMPAFVPYIDGNCCGCGMDISIEVNKKISKAGDHAECPNCGRIVYKTE